MRTGVAVNRMCQFLFPLVFAPGILCAEQRNLEAKIDELSLKLKSVDLQIEDYSTRIMTVHSKILNYQANASRTNAAMSSLANEIRHLEGVLHKKRQELDEQVRSTPEARELYAQRKLLTLDKQKLRDRKILIENELKAVRLRAAADRANQE